LPIHIILTEDVQHLGIAGQVVRVKDGYARNYLMPRGMAMLATDGRVKELAHKKRVIEEKQKKEISGHQEIARMLAKVSLSFEVQAGEEGKLFGSVTNADIHHQLTEQGFAVERRKIDLPDPIKQIGSYEVSVRLHREVIQKIRVQVVAAPGSAAAEAAEEEAEEERNGPQDEDDDD
jgi:large subunit ribosomal protein L9